MAPLFFFKDTEPHGFLCQWYLSPITHAGTTFSSAEQWMMYHKAVQSDDSSSQRAILATKEPRKQKSLGRKIKNFDSAKWDEVKASVVEQGNYLKFTQNDALRRELLETGERELAEASPFDRVWGVGVLAAEARVVPRERWGENMLGKALMRVRERIGKEEEEKEKEEKEKEEKKKERKEEEKT